MNRDQTPKIPFLELLPAYRELQAELDAAYHRVMSSGYYLLGPELESFEEEFSAFCGARHCVGVGSGLDARHLILRASGIGPGDEVIVPAHTFIATWLAVTFVGARPVPVEPDPRTYNIDPERFEASITSKTKAVIPVHLYGHPVDMDTIKAIASRHYLMVIEDAAQAHGACYKGKRCGGLGDAAGFSFYPAKNLGAFADAGAIVTNDTGLADKVRKLRNYGSLVKYHHECSGYNSRLDELQAAFLKIRLSQLEEWNDRRRKLANIYCSELNQIKNLLTPKVENWAKPVWHLFVVRHPDRDKIQKKLAVRGIGTQIHYPIPPHKSNAYKIYNWEKLPITEAISSTVLSLPMGPHFTESQISRVCAAVRESCGL